MSPTTFSNVLGGNIRARRSRLGLSQADVVERMRDLGFTAWHKPTLGNVERGQRRAQAEEVLGLAISLETTVQYLMSPELFDEPVELPSGLSLIAGQVRSLIFGVSGMDSERSSVQGARDVRGIRWQGNTLVPAESHDDDHRPDPSKATS